MSKINIGLIGTGNIAEEHIKILKTKKNICLYGVTSKTNKFSNQIKLKYNFMKVFKNYKDMAIDKNIDALFIVVSPDQSFNVIKNIIKYNKPFFCEKPAGLSLYQSRILKNLYLKYKTPNLIGFNRRYYSIFKKGLDYLNNNGGIRAINIEAHERFWKIKDIIKPNIKKKWQFANNIHMVDLILFFGGKIKNININSKKYDKSRFVNYLNASFEFKNSIIGSYSSYWNSPGGWSITLFGNKNTVVYKPLEKGLIIDSNFNTKKIKPNKNDLKFKEGFYLQIVDFIKLIKKNTLKVPNLITSYESMNLANKLYK